MDAASLIIAKAILGSSGGGGGAVQDVQVNGVSVLQDGVANVSIASSTDPGVMKINGNGLNILSNGTLSTVRPFIVDIFKPGTSGVSHVTLYTQHFSTFYGLAKAAGSDEKNSTLPFGQYTESAKSAISEMLNGSVSITGTTPSITALPGIRYVCGECATLDITLPASGIVDVVFESGSTATVLTITPPTGQTLKWANGFDPTALEANTVYEIRVRDGYLASALAWA